MNRLFLLSVFLVLFALSALPSSFNLIRKHSIVFDQSEEQVVYTAVDIFKSDLEKVSEQDVSSGKSQLIIGTIGKSKTVDSLIKNRHISVKDIKGKWEAFKIICLDDNRLVVAGSDSRGTAYGILELSRMMGVSPWEWWADVTPEKKSEVLVNKGVVTVQSPSVQYRGIFLNDEDWALVPWSSKNYEPVGLSGHIGPKTYSKIFELLLRLRANTLWPAMHEPTTPFYTVEGNKEAAQKYGIVIGTSHCEPMMRNNAGEWYKANIGRYNFKTNRDNIINYWAERLKYVSGTETFMTVGMRGVHDGRMEGIKTTEEYRDALHEVLDVQTDLLKKYINPDVKKIPQTIVLYKEVLNVYRSGLEVPDYVTLMWTDDNHGHIANLSNKEEQKRKGGSGIYYHISYWGSPHDYLWLCTTSPALINMQMRRAWDYNARKIWILNVGDIKPAEYDTELFMDMAWNINSIDNSNLSDHLRNWASREFGEKNADEIVSIMNEYYRLAAIRRPEHMGFNMVEIWGYPRGGLMPNSIPDFTEGEANQRIEDYDRIEKAVIKLSSSIPANRKDAFFQLVEYPVRAASQMNKKFLKTGQDALNAYNEIVKLTDYYNKKMSGGKWNYFMDMKPRDLPVFEPAIYTHKDDKLFKDDPVFKKVIDGSNFVSNNGEYTVYKGLGHSSNATMIDKGASLEYNFNVNKSAKYKLNIGFVPMQPANGGDLRVEVSFNGKVLGTFSIHEDPFTQNWRENILRNQAYVTLQMELENAKNNVLTVKALDDDIIIDHIKITSDI
ncbi:glycosyl hydrolase 115 family protein [uncultured Bacteroides sp.]|uniref:glycosyl hydrolase 115 family protein n=1 Tax=uncultured Bacteroides sp. TaxID=162156 RepID=UPI0026202336|nr:glycosyl hydrolase 115 family protein [uncultured Bacteroides sp.]